jgi:hypothetical protein
MLQPHLTPEPSRLATLWATFSARLRAHWRRLHEKRPTPVALPYPPLAITDEHLLPTFVTASPVALHYWRLLGGLDWQHFPERDAQRAWPGVAPMHRAPYAAAFLIKLDQQLRHMTDLRHYLVQHPALVWLLGFDPAPSTLTPWGFDAHASLPSQRQFSRVLRTLPNASLQFLLDGAVQLVRNGLPPDLHFGDEISLDTKHIIAWVKENNPNRFAPHRCDKTIQPKGDPDCKLGCKERSNQRSNQRHATDNSDTAAASAATTAITTPAPTPATTAAPSQADGVPTPTTNPLPASTLEVGTFYWGYASGIVTAKLPGWGEFVLAEYTQPFNAGETTYFFPLMQAVERRLGFRPRFGALDAAFDAFYVFDYFDQAGGFAAVPRVDRGHPSRTFSADGQPLCAAGLPMLLKYCYNDTTHLVPHQRGRYVCPLLYPLATGDTCPIQHKRWPQGGCIATVPTARGARIRCELDRASEQFTRLYAQRTTTERIFSQAKELGIERPKLRNQRSIANLNTLTYVLLNLRTWQRCTARRQPSA